MLTQLEEKMLLLQRINGYPENLALKLGKEIGEPYSLQFDDKSYDPKSCSYFNRDTAIPKIAERLTDSHLVSFCVRPETKAQMSKTNFLGKFYTLEAGELRLGSK